MFKLHSVRLDFAVRIDSELKAEQVARRRRSASDKAGASRSRLPVFQNKRDVIGRMTLVPTAQKMKFAKAAAERAPTGFSRQDQVVARKRQGASE